VLILTAWLLLMGAGGLCYPKAPRAAGVLFLGAGGFILIAWAAGTIGDAPPLNAAISVALGFGQLWKFRDRAVRAAHAAEWTRKA
jgi:hypothetical protein